MSETPANAAPSSSILTETPQLYLIAHKVRGEPAFDIAHCLCEGTDPCQPQCGLYPGCKDTDWWIISTSGRRAYPFWTCPLKDLSVVYEGGLIDPIKDALEHITEVPDHYSLNDRTIYIAIDEDTKLATLTAPAGKGQIRFEDLQHLLPLPSKPTITRR